MRTFAAILTCLVLAACSDEPATKNLQEAERPPAGSSQPAPAAKTTELKLSLLPENPGAGSDMQVQIAGCRERVEYAWAINGEPVANATQPQLAAGTYRRGDTVTATVKCGSPSLSASAVIANTLPVINKFSLKNQQVTAGEEIALIAEATDIDGDEIEFRYIWNINGEDQISPNGPVLPAGAVRSGDKISVTVIPSDRDGEGQPLQGTVFEVTNSPPHFVSRPPLSFRSAVYRYSAKADDPDGEQLTYRLEEAPPAMQINAATGEIIWQIPPDTVGSFTVRISAADPTGQQALQEYTITLAAEEKTP